MSANEVKSKNLLPIKDANWVVDRIQTAAKIHSINTSSKGNFFPLRPSSALKSERELYYGLQDYYNPGMISKTPIEGRNAMLLSLGHAIEKHLIEHTERAFAITHRNLRLNYGHIKNNKGEEIPLMGEFDFTIQSSETGELIIADSKSSADYPFSTGVPKDDHIAQINLYLHSAWARERAIKRAWIIYYNKNNSDLKCYEFEYNKELAESIINKFQKVYSAYEKGVIPNREHVLGSDWQAMYSQYRDHDTQEFKVPVVDRKMIILDPAYIEDLDRKELVKFFATDRNSGCVFKVGLFKYWLELGSTTLILKKEKV